SGAGHRREKYAGVDFPPWQDYAEPRIQHQQKYQEVGDMAFGRRMAAFNRLATNRVLGGVAPRLPGFGGIVHVGRRSGRRYRTPVNVFRTPTGYLLALTYGSGAEGVRNVLTAGGRGRGARGATVGPAAPPPAPAG